MSTPKIVYQRAGIYIALDDVGITIKKNGLTINIPSWVIDDFVNEFEIESKNIIQNKTMFDFDFLHEYPESNDT